MELELWQLNNIIKAAAKEAVMQFRLQLNPSDDEMTERQAFKEFGPGFVNHAVAAGLVPPPKRAGNKQNSRKIYSRYALMKAKNGADPLLAAVFK